MDRVKRIWYLSPMRAATVQASLHIRAVSPEPSLLAYTSSESKGTFRQKIRSLASLNGWTCAVKVCHDGMLEDTNSLDGAQIDYLVRGHLDLRIRCTILLLNFFLQSFRFDHLWRVKRICVFEHSVMTNFNCACPAIQRGQGSGFLSKGSS